MTDAVLRGGHGPLFTHLLSEMKSLEETGATVIVPEWQEIVQLFNRFLVEGVETLIDEAGEQMRRAAERRPDYLQAVFEEYQLKEIFLRLPDMTLRFLQLCTLKAIKLPPQEVSTYLKEATRCYIYGFAQATTALSRAAVEAALLVKIKNRGLEPPWSLPEKIRVAADNRLLTPEAATLASQVMEAGRSVLHHGPSSMELAFDALTSARGAVVDMYLSD